MNIQKNTTRLIHQLGTNKHKEAWDILFDQFYKTFHSAAHSQMMRERNFNPDHTMRSTELVHETYLKLFGSAKTVSSFKHLRNLTTSAMTKILIDYARKKKAAIRGSGVRKERFSDLEKHSDQKNAEEYIGQHAMEHFLSNFDSFDTESDREQFLEEALKDLREHHTNWYEVIIGRYFFGDSTSVLAQIHNVESRTIRNWIKNAIDHINKQFQLDISFLKPEDI